MARCIRDSETCLRKVGELGPRILYAARPRSAGGATLVVESAHCVGRRRALEAVFEELHMQKQIGCFMRRNRDVAR